MHKREERPFAAFIDGSVGQRYVASAFFNNAFT